GTDDVTDTSDAGDETVETPNGDGTTDGDPTNDPTVTTITPAPEFTLTKSASVGGDGLPGDVITYTFTVENTGNLTIDNVTIDDVLTGSAAVPVVPSTLAPGESGVLTATYTITQADVDAGYVENSAFATGQDVNGNDVLDISDAGDETIETPDGLGNTNGDPTDDPTVSDLISFPQLTFTKTASVGGSGGALGDVITYTFTVTNTGAQTVSNISIDDALTGSVEIVLNPSTLAPGETGIATAAYTIAQADVDAGYVQNSATVTGQDPMGNNVIDVSDAGNETIESPDGSGNVDGDPTNDPTVVLVDVEFEIFDAITPDDGDGQNDVFTIAGLQNFPDNNVKIYNRWGVLVYEKSQYHIGDGFRGISDGRVTIQQEKKLPAGVYYYVLTYVDGGVGKSIAGPLYIKR
ncbi:MAG: DUF11 domain-containing protein, partial [Flavobacteriaceae bacterium]|nr:DUF11 domain-containing protein [Flavobacteriaceae bacterium]